MFYDRRIVDETCHASEGGTDDRRAVGRRPEDLWVKGTFCSIVIRSLVMDRLMMSAKQCGGCLSCKPVGFTTHCAVSVSSKTLQADQTDGCCCAWLSLSGSSGLGAGVHDCWKGGRSLANDPVWGGWAANCESTPSTATQKLQREETSCTKLSHTAGKVFVRAQFEIGLTQAMFSWSSVGGQSYDFVRNIIVESFFEVALLVGETSSLAR
jgi:hypothetical protein